MNDSRVPVPPFLSLLIENIKSDHSLQNICRQAIRNHLLSIDCNSHLFNRIPKLGLPSGLNSYLLYNVSEELQTACRTSEVIAEQPEKITGKPEDMSFEKAI